MLLCRENAIARIQFLLSLLEKKLQNPPTEITYYKLTLLLLLR